LIREFLEKFGISRWRRGFLLEEIIRPGEAWRGHLLFQIQAQEGPLITRKGSKTVGEFRKAGAGNWNNGDWT